MPTFSADKVSFDVPETADDGHGRECDHHDRKKRFNYGMNDHCDGEIARKQFRVLAIESVEFHHFE